MPERTYNEKIDLNNELKLRDMLKNSLPRFCRDYFIGIEPTTSTRTRLSYAYDLTIFFDFIHKNNPIYSKMDVKDFPISLLDELKVGDIEEYLSYLRIYEKDGVAYSNKEKGVKRKLSSLRSMYNFLYRTERINTNPAEMVKTPKLHEKAITRLDIDEVATLLDQVESGEKLTKRQLAFHEQTKTRDLALMTLLLGTGIRVSECVGLNIDDVDPKNDAIKIHRKGGNEAIIYFGEEVATALYAYMDERAGIEAVDSDKNALFLSLQKKRINVRSVENLVKKYSKLVTTVKNITPHKLRSTYGTNLYRETGDIYLVADVLGHKDVNTTKRHYAAVEEDRRRSAANVVKLREK